MSFEEFGQRAIEVVRVHETWTAPIVFALAFAESLAFVSLVLPSWAALVGIGAIMKACGFKVFVQKLDPYLNVDPGTMSPFQHGEVFVTDDGAETDLDLGHYERFIDRSLAQANNITTGRIYLSVIT